MEAFEIKKNDEFEVTVSGLGSNGEGIAHHHGATIFIAGALVGERVITRIIKCSKTFFVGKLKEILSPSPLRVTAPCKYYEKCGGCDLQHISHAAQLEFKTQLVADTLKKYANIDADVHGAKCGAKSFGYRNKFAFPVCEKQGKAVIGMYRKNSHDVVEIEECLLQSELANKVVKIFSEFMSESRLTAWNEETLSGQVRHIVFRELGGSFLLTVVTSNKSKIDFSPLTDSLQQLSVPFGLYRNINPKKNNVILGEEDEHIFGLTQIEHVEFGIHYGVQNHSFVQVNDEVKTMVYEDILSQISSGDTVIDAYSGAGLLSAIISRKAAKVFGIEIVEEATKSANLLKKYNKIDNLTNFNGDCAKILPKLASSLSNFVLVLDPPRKGVDRGVLEAIKIALPEKVIYLSCNPATLARDAKELLESYVIKLVQPYDMFPQTANVETLMVFERKVDGKTE